MRLGVRDAGVFGDILSARMHKRGVAALVTDGMVRDLAGVVATGLPVWCAGGAAPASVASLTFVGWQEPIGCGGVAIFPDDIIVADGDGAVVIPQALLADVAAGSGRAGAARGLDHGRGREGRCASRTLSAERRDEGEVRDGAQIAGQPPRPGFGSASPN